MRSRPVSPRNSAFLLAALLTVVPTAAAASPERGLEIARAIEASDEGFGDTQVTLRMELENRQGQKSTRELRIRTLETPDPEIGDKSLTVFDHPGDIEGTAFLSFTKILDPDDQWLFLPALKRVKRIASANKSGPFVGSEFAYEDLTSFEVGKYDYNWLRDEACPTDAALTCHVVERFPKYENSGYTKQISWVDDAEHRIHKVEFYDRKEDLMKTLLQTDYAEYLDAFWRPRTMRMENHQTGKKTQLTFEDWQFQVGVSEADFNPRRLARAR